MPSGVLGDGWAEKSFNNRVCTNLPRLRKCRNHRLENDICFEPLWSDFATRLQGGILVVGHGTRNASGASELLELVQSMKARLPDCLPIEASFLELANPTIDEAVEKLNSKNCQNLLVIPILLFTAAHAREDIPDAVIEALKSRGMKTLAQSTSLGTDESALKLSEERFLSSFRCQNAAGCLKAGACDVADSCIANPGTLEQLSSSYLEIPSQVRIGLAMVGRGTSDDEARGHMIRLSKMRVDSSPVNIHWSQTGFFAGGTPNVSQLLEAAEESDCDWIVVQPHLLFEGHLSVQLRSMVDKLRKAGSKKRWLVAPTLGADPKLADTFLELGRKAMLSATKSSSIDNRPIVFFRSVNERHFRGVKGDTDCPIDPKTDS